LIVSTTSPGKERKDSDDQPCPDVQQYHHSTVPAGRMQQETATRGPIGLVGTGEGFGGWCSMVCPKALGRAGCPADARGDVHHPGVPGRSRASGVCRVLFWQQSGRERRYEHRPLGRAIRDSEPSSRRPRAIPSQRSAPCSILATVREAAST